MMVFWEGPSKTDVCGTVAATEAGTGRVRSVRELETTGARDTAGGSVRGGPRITMSVSSRFNRSSAEQPGE